MRRAVPLLVLSWALILTGRALAADGAPAEPLLSDIRQLTFGDAFDAAGEAYFSPDLTWIIFQATPPGDEHYQMYVAGFDSDNLRIGPAIRVSDPGSRNTCGYFSPDSQSILFATTAGKEDADEPAAGYQREGRDYRWSFPDGMELVTQPLPAGLLGEKYWSMAEQAQRAREAGHEVKADLALTSTGQRRLTDNDAYDAEGALSPDGRHLVFASDRNGDTEIYIGTLNGDRTSFEKTIQITDTPGYDGGPFFSPDGKRLVYRSDRQGNDLLQVFVRELQFDHDGKLTGGGKEMQVTDDEHVNWGPYWHPSGEWLIFATSRHGHQNYELYLIRPDGTDASRVTNSEGFDGLPVFSNDGKYLMWTSKRGGDGSQLFLARFQLPGEDRAAD